MVYFTEKLIHEIRKRSCIWDTADVNHLNKDVLTNMWMEIAENLYSDWHTLSAFDKRDRVGDVKKKWTNIKDSFVKDVKGNKPRKSRGPPEHRKKYYLFDHLQFLIPFIQDSNESKKRVRKGLGEGPSRMHTPSASSTTVVTAKTGIAITAGTASKPDALPDVQQHADLLNNIAGKSAADSLCQLDGDLSFMVSLLPTIKSMNEKQKINFKIGVLQLLARIKFNEVLQNPADVAAAYQPFATPDLRCLAQTVPPFNQHHQSHHLPFPFNVNHQQHHQRQHRQSSSSSSTAQHYASGTAATPPMSVKQETVELSPASTSSFENSDREDYDDVSDANNN